jgi:hypothetical protein
LLLVLEVMAPVILLLLALWGHLHSMDVRTALVVVRNVYIAVLE